VSWEGRNEKKKKNDIIREQESRQRALWGSTLSENVKEEGGSKNRQRGVWEELKGEAKRPEESLMLVQNRKVGSSWN